MYSRLILLTVVAAIVAVGYFGGFVQYLAPDRLGELLIEAGPWGPLVIVLLFAVLEPFGVPGAIFLLTAATLWPFWLAFLVNWLGATAAGMLGFGFARYVGRDWVEGRMPERLRKWDERLSERGLPLVILFRLVFFLNPASHWALGLSRVSVSAAVGGTVIGFAPAIALWTYFGAEILEWFGAQPTWIWIVAAVVLGAVIAVRVARGRAARRAAA